MQILRYEIQFLKFENSTLNAKLKNIFTDIQKKLNSHNPSEGLFVIWAGNQRAMGELMVTTDHNGQRCCIGYAEFRQKWLNDEAFKEWFIHPAEELEKIARSPKGMNDQRLRDLQRLLISFIRLLDPQCERIAANVSRPLESRPRMKERETV
jgi:hypothetical protein